MILSGVSPLTLEDAACGEQLCQASGGPCTYTGRNMKAAHAGMGVSSDDFDALVGDLVTTLNKFKVPEREKKTSMR